MTGKFTIKVSAKPKRNLAHFEVQRTTKAMVFRDKTKYTRKAKHKECYC